MKNRIAMGLLGALMMTSTSVANDKWEDQVRSQLTLVESMFDDDGYDVYGNVKVDTMTDDEIDNFTFTLSKGTNYVMVGACDEDCGDIDFWLYDEYDNEIEKDVSDDDVPMVYVTPHRTSEFRLKVRMYNCTSDPCYHGFVILKK